MQPEEPSGKRFRDTGTGRVLELMVLPALQAGGYSCAAQCHVGSRLGGGKHMVDVVASDRHGKKLLVSVKWQQVSGTAEQKVPFESICLADAIARSAGEFERGYLVLGGEGWKLREFFTTGGLADYLQNCGTVSIVTLEWFVAKAIRGEL